MHTGGRVKEGFKNIDTTLDSESSENNGLGLILPPLALPVPDFEAN